MADRAGVSRRQVLTRGAVVGGALVWGVPLVQVLDTGRAFAAQGSGTPVTPPTTPPVTTHPTHPVTPTAPTTPGSPLPVSVQGETFTNGAGGADGTGVAVLGTTTTAGNLPFTGSSLPVRTALETGAGLIAGGIVLRSLGARRGRVAAEAPTDETPDAPVD